MRIGIDIDDTITDLQEDLFTEALKYDATLRGKGVIYPERHYIAQRFDWSEEEKEYYLGELRWNVYSNAKIREGVHEVLKILKEEGNEIIFITARSNRYNDFHHNDTKSWLNRNNIIYDKLITGALDKGEACKNENIDIFIDDQEKNCMLTKNAGVKTIFFNIESIETNDSYIVAYSWHDILNKINALMITEG